jgi:hypothetical protein
VHATTDQGRSIVPATPPGDLCGQLPLIGHHREPDQVWLFFMEHCGNPCFIRQRLDIFAQLPEGHLVAVLFQFSGQTGDAVIEADRDSLFDR